MERTMPEPGPVLSVRRGHAPNCSASGSVVGVALVSVVAAAAVVNALAERFARWVDRRPPPAAPSSPREPAPADPSPGPGPSVRREAFGGLLAWPDPPALLLLDPAGAQAAIDAGARVVGGHPLRPGALSAPSEVHVAVTARCPVTCDTCYLDAGPHRDEPDDALLDDDLVALADAGVFEIALGGGEVLARADLVDRLARIRALGMVPNLTTSGLGLTDDLARAIAPHVGQVNVSIDGLGADYARVRGWDGTAVALRAIGRLRDAGVRVGVNTVLTAASWDGLDALADLLVALGVHEWQWLRLKPAGRAAATYAQHALTPGQRQALWPRLLALEARTGLVLRVDCALVPFVVAHAPPLEAVERLGLTGCPGGESLLARDADGRWAPCSFVTEPAARDGGPAEAWAADPTLLAWRDRAAAPPEPCASCTYRAVCRGGCRVVAAHHTGDALAPDPECPRVVAARSAA